MSDDRDLRDAFARLRDAERRGIPPFRIPAQSQPVLRARGALRLAAAAALLLLVISLGYLSRQADRGVHQPATPRSATSISEWRAPTDFLLRTPGSELIVSTPRIRPHLPQVNTIKGARS
jgi:hypothetical protein